MRRCRSVPHDGTARRVDAAATMAEVVVLLETTSSRAFYLNW
jgi:hypothetical protein